MRIIKFIRKHGATILTILGGGGVVGTAIASTVDHNRYWKLKDSDGFDPGKALKAYIPTIAIGGATIGCIFGSNGLNKKELAALGAICAAGAKRFDDYRREIVERYGKEADREIVTEISKKAPTFTQEEISWRDPYTGKIFKRYEVEVIDAEAHFNRHFVLHGSACLNDLREYLGLDPLIPIGYDKGWSFDQGHAWIDFEHKLRDDGTSEIVPLFPPITDYMYDWKGDAVDCDYPREDD